MVVLALRGALALRGSASEFGLSVVCRNLDFLYEMGAKVLAVSPPRGPPLEIERARANDGHKRCAQKRVRQFGQAQIRNSKCGLENKTCMLTF